MTSGDVRSGAPAAAPNAAPNPSGRSSPSSSRRGAGHAGRSRGNNRSRGSAAASRAGRGGRQRPKHEEVSEAKDNSTDSKVGGDKVPDRPSHSAEGDDASDDAVLCFICANPVAYHSIAPCNHTTCHICGLRMRALYKDKNCAHCRVRCALPVVLSAPYTVENTDVSHRRPPHS